MSITLQVEKARIYFIGNTFPMKDKIKAIGGHWDGDRKAWWVGSAKADAAKKLVDGTASVSASENASDGKKVADDAKVIAKANYKGRTYYVLWMGRCQSGAEKARLTVLDGSIDFWVDLSLVEITKRYEPRRKFAGYGRGEVDVYQTLGGLRRFMEKLKRGDGPELHLDLEDGQMKPYAECDIPQ